MAASGNPAYSAAMGNFAGMALIAGGTMALADGLLAGLDAIAENRRRHAYVDALDAAAAHSEEMEQVARAAVTLIAELEGEVAQLRAACLQRQELIDTLVGNTR
ncbi:hypothetical protein [Pararhizobium arenae]|uniref:hypothetical protein n=1 Tax=Pararhizobium arenae TaxID=1856850 RepID=UPI00094AAA42|nr:hypothetical protein [Pararhizobium arenae]